MTQTDQRQQAAAAAMLLAAYQSAGVGLRARVVQLLVSWWRSLGSWRNGDIQRFLDQAIPLVQAGQRQAAQLAAAHLARDAEIAGRSLPMDVPIDPTTVRRVDPAEEYARPFHDVWRALGDGKSLDDAVQAAEEHLTVLAQTDLQLAKTNTAQAILADAKDVTGWRRILEGQYSCGLCIIAATRLYHKAELMAIHPACDCSVAPVYDGIEPAGAITLADLPSAHDAIAQRFGADSAAAREIPGTIRGDGSAILYRDALIVHDHGEIGPVLTVRGQQFTGPGDLHTTP